MGNIFDGLKVIDITNNLAGPLCAQLFGDYGAEVIKVERPGAGDDSRGLAPKIEGVSLFPQWSARNKKSVTLALDDPRAQKIILEMAKEADVFIESYKPGMMKKFNLDYEAVSKVNPGIVYASISVAGQVGPKSKVPGFDIIAQAMSGFMDNTGEKTGNPTKCGTVIGDYVGGLNAFASILAALLYKQKTGEGQYCDVSLLAGLVGVNTLIDRAATLGDNPTRSGNHHGSMAPYGLYNGNNGQSCIIAAYTGKMWPNLCQVIGQPELATDPRFDSNVTRTKNIGQLVEVLETWLKTFDDIDEPVKLMADAGIATCKVYTTQDVADDPEYRNLGLIVDMDTPPSLQGKRDKVTTRGSWFKFSKCQPVYHRAPDLGEHNEEILLKYISKEELDQCLADWAGKFKKQ